MSTHYSLYGYSFKTTPKLDNLYRENQLIKIDNVTKDPTNDDMLKTELDIHLLSKLEEFYKDKEK